MTVAEVLSWTGGRLVGNLAPETELAGVCRNTQALRRGELFVPLRGAQRDGHCFVIQAAVQGAAATLCDAKGLRSFPEIRDSALPRIEVEDTMTAVQALAAGLRRKSGLTVIGVTGSVGKTTTSQMIALTLEKRHRLARTLPDMNGQVGLTFAICGLGSEDLAVWEMGMSLPGELSRLTKMARPDIALVNAIGTAHIAAFGTRERICQEKLTVAEGLPKGGKLVLCGDEPLLRREDFLQPIRERGVEILYYGLDGGDVHGEMLEETAGGSRFLAHTPAGSQEIYLPSPGRHNVQNALGAVTVAWLCGVPLPEIAEGLSRFENVQGRQRILHTGGYTVMEDCYNASPDAVVASLGVLKSQPAARRFAVLGGMLELGDYAAEGHRKCGERAAACADWLCVYGEGTENTLRGALAAGMPAERCLSFDTHEAMAAFLRETAKPGDALLFKGSKLMHMEKVLEAFLNPTEE